ncbi:MAG: GntR family transcriptional regulator [Armatimonadota bacterium]|nr:GntR family transcriptional regulator [Armatimonadota bacterium]
MAVRPFQNVTLSQQVRDHLRREILSNRLAPGAHLHEEVIASELGISRAPVREALRLLAAEDLVTIAPRRGAVVRELSADDFRAAYQVREALETLAVRLAVPRMGDDDHVALRELYQRMSDAAAHADAERFGEADAAFHIHIVERSGNKRLIEIYKHLKNQIRQYRRWSMALRGGFERSLVEHAAILGAIDAGDVETAVQRLAEHLRAPQVRLEANAREGRA